MNESEMVESLAEAMHEAEIDAGRTDMPWGADEIHRRYHRFEARAALAWCREHGWTPPGPTFRDLVDFAKAAHGPPPCDQESEL